MTEQTITSKTKKRSHDDNIEDLDGNRRKSMKKIQKVVDDLEDTKDYILYAMNYHCGESTNENYRSRIAYRRRIQKFLLNIEILERLEEPKYSNGIFVAGDDDNCYIFEFTMVGSDTRHEHITIKLTYKVGDCRKREDMFNPETPLQNHTLYSNDPKFGCATGPIAERLKIDSRTKSFLFLMEMLEYLNSYNDIIYEFNRMTKNIEFASSSVNDHWTVYLNDWMKYLYDGVFE